MSNIVRGKRHGCILYKIGINNMYVLIVFLSGPEAEAFLGLNDDKAIEALSDWDNGEECLSDSEQYYGIKSEIIPGFGDYIAENQYYLLVRNHALQHVALYRKVNYEI